MRDNAVSYLDPWFRLMVSSLDNPALRSPHGDRLPGFPPEQMQRNTTSLAGSEALQQAYGFYRDIHVALVSIGTTIEATAKILDFGIGWGRIARFFMHDVPLCNIYGIDVDAEFVNISRKLFGSENFDVCGPMPPIQYSDGMFDLVTAYSVFSHLSGPAFLAWMREFAQILRPRGYVAFTTRGESFFDYCGWARQQIGQTQGYLKALGELFPDVEAARRQYRDGHLVFATSHGVSGGGVRNESFYGETFIPRPFVEMHLGDLFEISAFDPHPANYDQALFVLRRR